jgi:HIV Tat-specific factor 1
MAPKWNGTPNTKPGCRSYVPLSNRPQRLISKVYDEELAAQQSAYSVAGVDELIPIERPKKRKKKAAEHENGNDEKRAKQDNNDYNNSSEDRLPKRERRPTAVYVSNLPLDVSAAELQEHFAKCGMIAEDGSGQKRLKMYYDEDGKFKGDALVTYFKPESVPLALQMLDETSLPRADGRSSPLIRVQLVYKT